MMWFYYPIQTTSNHERGSTEEGGGGEGGPRRTEIIGGRNPSGVAAVCLYAAAREHEAMLTQKEAAAVADVSTATIRSTVDALRDRQLTSA